VTRASRIVSESLVLAALCLLTCAAAAGLTLVDGTVVDIANGLPVAGASVVLESNGSPIARARTGKDGTFKLPSIPPGNYEIIISAKAYQLTHLTGFTVLKVTRRYASERRSSAASFQGALDSH
jgi:Carboxypeptidase regulatory-like domain